MHIAGGRVDLSPVFLCMDKDVSGKIDKSEYFLDHHNLDAGEVCQWISWRINKNMKNARFALVPLGKR